MRISKRKGEGKDSWNFCDICGKRLEKEEYVINLGTSGSTFEFCRSCMRKIKNGTEKVLNK